jgi:hypothetical protein
MVNAESILRSFAPDGISRRGGVQENRRVARSSRNDMRDNPRHETRERWVTAGVALFVCTVLLLLVLVFLFVIDLGNL